MIPVIQMGRACVVTGSESFRRKSGMLFEEPDEVGGIFIAKVIGDFIDLISGCQKISFAFQNYVFSNQL